MIQFKILKVLDDGGTLIIRHNDGWVYYVDRRTNTTTYDWVYKTYPDKEELISGKKANEILKQLKKIAHVKN